MRCVSLREGDIGPLAKLVEALRKVRLEDVRVRILLVVGLGRSIAMAAAVELRRDLGPAAGERTSNVAREGQSVSSQEGTCIVELTDRD